MVVKTGGSYPMARERNVILASLFALAGGAWALLLWQSTTGDEQAMGLTMGMGAYLFLANWVAMMVAVMFPTAAPMVLMFARVHAGKRQQGQAFVPTWVFISSYLAVWAAVGVLFFGAAVAAERLGDQQRRPFWRRRPRSSRPLPAFAFKALLPGEVPHTSRFHPGLLAGWLWGGVSP